MSDMHLEMLSHNEVRDNVPFLERPLLSPIQA